MFLHLKSQAIASLSTPISHHRLTSLALCSHLCTFLILQPNCSVQFSLPLDYFHLSLCLNEVIHIFSLQISQLFCGHAVSSTDFLSLLFYFCHGAPILTHVFCLSNSFFMLLSDTRTFLYPTKQAACWKGASFLCTCEKRRTISSTFKAGKRTDFM